MPCSDLDDGEGDFVAVVPESERVKGYDVESNSLSVADIQRDMRSDVEHVVSIFGLEVCIYFHRKMRSRCAVRNSR